MLYSPVLRGGALHAAQRRIAELTFVRQPPQRTSGSKMLESLFSSKKARKPTSSAPSSKDDPLQPEETALEKLERLRRTAGEPSVKVS